jgi:hypothetical protein
LGLNGEVPDHSIFSKNRYGRSRESNLLRKLFDRHQAEASAAKTMFDRTAEQFEVVPSRLV